MQSDVLQQVRERDAEKKKQQAQQYADARNYLKERHTAVGDSVVLGRREENKLSLAFESKP